MENLQGKVIPKEGVTLPVKWGDLGSQLTTTGTIDSQKFESLYTKRGGLNEEEKAFLYGKDYGNIKITPQNSQFLLNMFWAVGIGNKNAILEKGPMTDPQYGGAQGFASTGGWTIGKGNPMDHYSKHKMITLTEDQQKRVEEVSRNIYRPCCNNSTYFPDCNHGMAMLGLLELMASQGLSEEKMYENALIVNSYWFPDTYLTIGKYMKMKKSLDWEDVNPKEVLGINFSSRTGYSQIVSEITPAASSGGGGCSV